MKEKKKTEFYVADMSFLARANGFNSISRILDGPVAHRENTGLSEVQQHSQTAEDEQKPFSAKLGTHIRAGYFKAIFPDKPIKSDEFIENLEHRNKSYLSCMICLNEAS